MAQRKRKSKFITPKGDFFSSDDIRKLMGDKDRIKQKSREIKSFLKKNDFMGLDAALDNDNTFDFFSVQNGVKVHSVYVAEIFADYLKGSIKDKKAPFLKFEMYSEWKEVASGAWTNYFQSDCRLDKRNYKNEESLLSFFFETLTQRMPTPEEVFVEFEGNPGETSSQGLMTTEENSSDLSSSKVIKSSRFKNMDEALSWFEEGIKAFKKAEIDISYAKDFIPNFFFSNCKDERFYQTFKKHGGQLFLSQNDRTLDYFYEDIKDTGSEQLGWRSIITHANKNVAILEKAFELGFRFNQFHTYARDDYFRQLLVHFFEYPQKESREDLWEKLRKHDALTNDTSRWVTLNHVFSAAGLARHFLYLDLDEFKKYSDDPSEVIINPPIHGYDEEREVKYNSAIKILHELLNWMYEKAHQDGLLDQEGLLFRTRQLFNTNGCIKGALFTKQPDLENEAYNWMCDYFHAKRLEKNLMPSVSHDQKRFTPDRF